MEHYHPRYLPKAERTAELLRPCGGNSFGFTIIELLISISVMSILGLMAVPGTVRAIARGSTNQAAEDLLRVAHQAEQFAKRGASEGPAALAPHWGVALVEDNGTTYATVLYGATSNDEWMVDSQPGYRMTLPPLFTIEADTGGGLQPLSGRLAWFYQYGTGWPIERPDRQMPINVGTEAQAVITQESSGSLGGGFKLFRQFVDAVPASPICLALRVRRNSSRYAVAVAVYDYGMNSARGMELP